MFQCPRWIPWGLAWKWLLNNKGIYSAFDMWLKSPTITILLVYFFLLTCSLYSLIPLVIKRVGTHLILPRMGFHITEATCYLTADMFYLEVVLLLCGGVEEVKVAPHGGYPVVSGIDCKLHYSPLLCIVIKYNFLPAQWVLFAAAEVSWQN